MVTELARWTAAFSSELNWLWEDLANRTFLQLEAILARLLVNRCNNSGGWYSHTVGVFKYQPSRC